MQHWTKRLPHVGNHTIAIGDGQEQIMKRISELRNEIANLKSQVRKLEELYVFQEESILTSVRQFWPEREVNLAINP